MRNMNKVLALLVGLSLLLAACSGSDTADNDNPGLTEVPGGITTPADATPVGPLETPPVVTPDNATPSPEGPITSTLPAATPMATETVEVTESVSPTVSTGGEVLPPTGVIDPGRLSNLLDFEVWNMENEQIGEVEDIVLDLGESRVKYVVIDVEDNEDDIAVPWRALKVVTAQATTVEGPQNAFVLNVDQGVFDATPAFDLDALPELGEDASDWDVDIDVFWKENLDIDVTTTTTPTTSSGLMGVVRATELLDYELKGGDGEVEAEVEDAVVDVESGDIQYLIVGISEGLLGPERLIPVPLSVLSWDAENDTLIVTADPQVILTAPSFEIDAFPETLLPDWDVDFRTYWETYIDPTP